MYILGIREGEELKAPRHASAAATRDGNLPYSQYPPPSVSLQRTPKSLNFNLKYLNHYLIIFSKNLNISFYIPILVSIIILERIA